MVLLPIEEEDALRRVLRHHGVPLTDPLVKDLAELIGWVRQLEKSKAWPNTPSPPPMLVLLSTLGIYGGEAIGPTPPTGVTE